MTWVEYGNDVDGGGLASVSPVEYEDAVALDDEVDGRSGAQR